MLDLEAVSTVAVDQVRKLSGKEPVMQIAVTRRGMGSSSYESLAEFGAMPGRDLPKVETISIRIGTGQWFQAPRVTIDLSRKGWGVSVEVVADDEDSVQSALTVIGKQVGDGVQVPRIYPPGVWQVGAVIALSFAALLAIAAADPAFLTTGVPGGSKLTLAQSETGAGVVAAFLLLGFVLKWLFVSVELLPPNGEPRLKRLYFLVLLPIGMGVVSILIARLMHVS